MGWNPAITVGFLLLAEMEADNVVERALVMNHHCWPLGGGVLDCENCCVRETQTGALWTAVVALNELSVLSVLLLGVSVLASITVDVRIFESPLATLRTRSLK